MRQGYIKKSDFVGDIRISQNTKEVNTLEYYIDKYFKEILIDLVGDFQYNHYLVSTGGSSFSSYGRFNILLKGQNPDDTQFIYWDKDGVYTNYYGLVSAMRYFIYWFFVRDLRSKVTSVGVKFPDSELSVNPSQNQINSVIEERYNMGVDDYMCGYKLLQDLYDMKVHFNSITDNGDYTYTILLKQINGKNSLNVGYLIQEGDVIELEKEDYVVLSNDIGTTPNEANIVIETTSGKTFTETHFYIDPFLDSQSKRKEYSVLDGFL